MSIKRPTKWSRTAQLPQTGYTLERRGGGEIQHNSLRLDTLWGGGVGEKNSTAPSDWIHFGEEGWGRKTTQLPQTGYTLGRRGGGEKQHSSLRLDTLWGGGVAEWNNTMHSDWIYFGGWGGEAEQNVSLSSVHLGGGVGSNSKQLSSELVHLSTVKAIIVPASPLTAKLKFRIKMGWLDKIPKIEKKTFLNKISAIRSTNCSAFPGTMYVEHTLLTKWILRLGHVAGDGSCPDVTLFYSRFHCILRSSCFTVSRTPDLNKKRKI